VTRRLIVSAVVAWLLATLVFGALRLTLGERPAFVHVRWSAGVDENLRRRLEQTYKLDPVEFKEGTTWAYYLVDVSRANIRALVGDMNVEDTHQIHRTAFRPWRTAPRGQYPGPWPDWLGTTLEWTAGLLAVVGAVALGLAALRRVGVPRPLQWPTDRLSVILTEPASTLAAAVRAGWRWLECRIPPGSAEAVAAFRIVFGTACLAYFASSPANPDWLDPAGPPSVLQRAALAVFQDVPAVVPWIRPWNVFWSALFIAGVTARTSFAMLTAGALAWALLYTTRIGSHSVGVLLVAMIALLWSRWGDVWSVDAWRKKRVGGPASAGSVPPRVYGYTTWIPGVVLGVSFAAAAIAKLRESGIAWITNGSVRYHFLSDSDEARVDWGLQLAQYDGLAILMSFAAIAIEALVIVGALSARYRYRLLAGIGALMLLIGFWLFQGLFWPAWHILLLSFLPWHRIGRTAGSSVATGTVVGAAFNRPVRIAQAAALAVLLGQQVVTSAFRLELDPLLSTYDMYSTSYSSPEAYEQAAGLTYWAVADFADGTSDGCKVSRGIAEALASRSADAARWRRAIETCFDSPVAIRSISIEGRRRTVDWTQWRFAGEVRVPIAGPLPFQR
jgi:hypothetical protein